MTGNELYKRFKLLRKGDSDTGYAVIERLDNHSGVIPIDDGYILVNSVRFILVSDLDKYLEDNHKLEVHGISAHDQSMGDYYMGLLNDGSPSV